MKGDLRTAATLMVLMGEETAAQVVKHLNEPEIERLSREISDIGPLDSEQVEKSAEQIYVLLSQSRVASEGGVDFAKRVIQRALGTDSAKRVMDRISSNFGNENAFETMGHLNPAQLSQFVQNEHPQTIALILAHLPLRSSAELLSILPEEMQAEVAVRMAQLESISPEIIFGISKVLQEKLKPVGSFSFSRTHGGIRAVAEMFNRMDRQQRRAVLESIESEKPEIANSIRQLMFIFEDIAKLDDTAIREILQRVDRKTIAQALKGANEAQQNQFFRNMSQRAVEMMQEEIDVMGPVKMRDVNEAQQKIVQVVRKLEEDGVIVIGGGAGDDYVV